MKSAPGVRRNKYKVECKFIESVGDFHSIDLSIKCNLFGKYSFLGLDFFHFVTVAVVVAVLIHRTTFVRLGPRALTTGWLAVATYIHTHFGYSHRMCGIVHTNYL